MIEHELRDHIIEQPWQSVGIAALLGAAFGVMSPRGKLGQLIGATVSALAVRFLRELTVHELSKNWNAEHAS